MKKLFTALLAAVMCTSLCLASCKKAEPVSVDETNHTDTSENREENAITVEEVEAAPLAAFEKALSVEFDSGIAKTFENIGKSETVHVEMSVPETVKLELWANTKEDNPGVAFEAYGEGSDEGVFAHLTGKEAAIGVGKVAYGIPLENFKENFENAKFWDFAGITPDEFYQAIEAELGVGIDELVKNIEAFMNRIEVSNEKNNEELAQILAGAVKNVDLRKVGINHGELDAVVIEYLIDTDFLEDLSYWYLDVLEENPLNELMSMAEDYGLSYNNAVDQYEETFDMLISSFDESVEKLCVDAAINPMNGRLCQLTFAIDPDDDIEAGAEYVIELDLGRDFTKSEKFLLDAYTKYGDDIEPVATIALTAKNDGKKLDYAVTAKSYYDREASEEVEIVAFRADLEEKRYTVYYDEEEIVSGSIDIREGYFSIDFDGTDVKLSIDYDDTSFETKLEAEGETMRIFVDDEKLPEAPDYKNLFEMTEEEFFTLAEMLNMGGAYESVEPDQDHVASTSSELAEYAENLNSQLSGIDEAETFEMKVEARDNSIVLEYTYLIDIGSVEDAAEAMNATFDGMTESVSDYVQQMRDETGIDIYSLIYEYYTKDGELIILREFR